MKNKKALSPVIATMLLIVITIVIGLIVFLWLREITEEAITKFDGTNIKVVCDQVKFDASYSSGYIYILNTGNVHIYQMKAKLFGDGNYSTETLNQGWPAQGLGQGATFYGSLPETTNKVVLIPVLIGHSSKGDVAYTCEDRQGYELII